MNNADSISRSTSASKHHFAFTLHILRDVLFYLNCVMLPFFLRFFGELCATNNSSHIEHVWEVNSLPCFWFVWVLFEVAARLMEAAMYVVSLDFTYLIFQHDKIIYQTISEKEPTNAKSHRQQFIHTCRYVITILHFAQTVNIQFVMCLSNHLHRAMLTNADFAMSLSSTLFPLPTQPLSDSVFLL